MTRRPNWRRIAGWFAIVVLVLAIPLSVALLEQMERWHAAAAHERLRVLSEQRALQFGMAVGDAELAGQEEKAERFRTQANYWGTKAVSHERMSKEYGWAWWELSSR